MLARLTKLHEPRATVLLLLLLFVDIVLIGLHITLETLASNPSQCNISGICLYMNVYHLIKIFVVVALFALILRSGKDHRYASWILMFTCFLIDDAFLLHQKVGDRMAKIAGTYLPSNLGFHPRDYQLAVLALAGIFLLAVVAWGYVHGDHEFRKISNDMFVLIAALVFFGLLVDVATALKLGRTVRASLGFVEDGGELVVYSLILWDVFLLAMRKGRSDAFLLDLLGRPSSVPQATGRS